MLCVIIVHLHYGNTCSNVPQFIHLPLITFWLFQVQAIVNNDSIYTFLFLSFGIHKHTFPLGLYLKVKLLDHMVFKYLTLVEKVKPFSKCNTNLYSHQQCFSSTWYLNRVLNL